MTAIRPVRALRHLSSAAGTRTFTSSSRLSQLARMQLIGRLGATPELSQTAQGREIVRYSIATSSGYGENKVTSWFNVAYFPQDGGSGETHKSLLTSLAKGSLVWVEADGRMRSVQMSDGTTNKLLSLVERSLQVLDRPRRDAEEEVE